MRLARIFKKYLIISLVIIHSCEPNKKKRKLLSDSGPDSLIMRLTRIFKKYLIISLVIIHSCEPYKKKRKLLSDSGLCLCYSQAINSFFFLRHIWFMEIFYCTVKPRKFERRFFRNTQQLEINLGHTEFRDCDLLVTVFNNIRFVCVKETSP